MARKSTSKKESATTITLEQFKSWLQGVEDMQADNWSPNKEQWARIREKIDLIEEQNGEHTAPKQRRNSPAAAPTALPAGSSLDFSPRPSTQFIPGQTAQPYIGELPTTPGVPDPTKLPPGKTPDIDSTNGYQSMFV